MKRIETVFWRYFCVVSSFFLNLFYIPWMKRIETQTPTQNILRSLSKSTIYSIYLEWKGLRQIHICLWRRESTPCNFLIYSIYLEWKGLRLCFFLDTLCWVLLVPKSILYTLNEKDWDFQLIPQNNSKYTVLNFIYSIYLEWKGLRRIKAVIFTCTFRFNLFYIPWMKRIETFSSTVSISCLSLFIYSIYLEWKGLRLQFNCLHQHCLCISILYTLNEKDWDISHLNICVRRI